MRLHPLVKALFGLVAFNLFYPRWLIIGIHRLRGVKVDASDNTLIAYNVIIDLIYPEYVEIEAGVWLTQQCKILAHCRPTTLQQKMIGGDRVKPVKICRGAYVGHAAIILPGVTVGEYAVVGAGAVVTRDVPPRTVVAGNPARVIKRIEEIAPAPPPASQAGR